MTNKKESPIIVKIYDEQVTQKQEIKKQAIPITSPFEPLAKLHKRDLTWKIFYEQKLQEYNKSQSNLTHNEITSKISQEWKKIKKQVKKNQKNKKVSNLSIQKPVEETDKIQQLKNANLKLIFQNLAFELKGEIVLEALSRNCGLIYLNTPAEPLEIINLDEEPIPNKIAKYL